MHTQIRLLLEHTDQGLYYLSCNLYCFRGKNTVLKVGSCSNDDNFVQIIFLSFSV